LHFGCECVKYQRKGLTLETEYNPTTEGIRYQSINGRVAKTPQLQATNLPQAKVPWLEGNSGTAF